ncbi:MAG: DNA polymerase III subunit beta, partial [Muribaculaceae bacterium]|nr:DNA polymerase III subunit beta [Muribaculaceae bacterium]
VHVTDVEGEGKFCVDARRLTDLLKSMPDLGITFEIDDNNLAIEIKYPGGTYNFIGINGNEYPRAAADGDDDEKIEFDCQGEQLITGIDNTLFAVGTDDLRPQMMGILWDIKPDSITFVATDTRKMVKFSNATSAPGVEGSCIVPLKPATVIKNVFGKDVQLHVTITNKRAQIESEAFKFSCQLLKGMYPDYNRVIPANNPYMLTVDRQSFLAAIRRVGVFVDPSHGLVKFKITPDKIILKATDSNFCTQAVEEAPCDFNHSEMVIGFSAPYLIEIFSTLSTPEVVVKLSDPSRPGVFLPSENAGDCELLMLLMPMNVSDF